MAKQQVDAVKLKKAGTQLTDLSAKLKKEMKNLDDDIQKVSSVWNSEAADTYVQSYNQDKANLDELVVITRQMGEALAQFSANYQKADSKALDVVGKHLAKG